MTPERKVDAQLIASLDASRAEAVDLAMRAGYTEFLEREVARDREASRAVNRYEQMLEDLTPAQLSIESALSAITVEFEESRSMRGREAPLVVSPPKVGWKPSHLLAAAASLAAVVFAGMHFLSPAPEPPPTEQKVIDEPPVVDEPDPEPIPQRKLRFVE